MTDIHPEFKEKGVPSALVEALMKVHRATLIALDLNRQSAAQQMGS